MCFSVSMFTMALDRSYSKLIVSLSAYAEDLGSVAKQEYIRKLRFHHPPDKIVILDDPYFISEWKSDTSLWPSVSKTDFETYLAKFPGQNYESKKAFNYVVTGKNDYFTFNICI